MHGPACRCAWCRAPRKAGKRRPVARLRIKSRAELVAEGLLPGLDAAWPDVARPELLPQPKGTL